MRAPRGENGSSGVKAQVHTYLTKLIRAGAPLWFIKLHGNRYQRANAPDFLICAAGLFIAIELKGEAIAPIPSAGQAHELSKIKRAQGYTLCANTLHTVQVFVETILSAHSSWRKPE